MFIVLNAEHGISQNKFRRFADRLKKPQLYHEQREVMGGQYVYLNWKGASDPDWEAIERLCRVHGGRLIVSESITVPPGINIVCNSFPLFESAMLTATACEIAKKSYIPLYKKVLGIIDDDAYMIAGMGNLLKYYSCIKVVSKSQQLYQKAAEKMYKDLGAPVITGCKEEFLDDCMLVITRDKAKPGVNPPKAPVMCAGGYYGGSPCLSMLQIKTHDEILSACPSGVSPNKFAAALYEYSGVKDIDVTAEYMICNYQLCSLAEVAEVIRKNSESCD